MGQIWVFESLWGESPLLPGQIESTVECHTLHYKHAIHIMYRKYSLLKILKLQMCLHAKEHMTHRLGRQKRSIFLLKRCLCIQGSTNRCSDKHYVQNFALDVQPLHLRCTPCPKLSWDFHILYIGYTVDVKFAWFCWFLNSRQPLICVYCRIKQIAMLHQTL